VTLGSYVRLLKPSAPPNYFPGLFFCPFLVGL
jgi:hypothetical protein